MTFQTKSTSNIVKTAAISAAILLSGCNGQEAKEASGNAEKEAAAASAEQVAEAAHEAFTMESFTAAQEAGKSILVDVYADWCSTCRAQQPILAEIHKMDSNKDVVIFRMDFDKQKEYVEQFKIPRQATLISFKGKDETGRLIASKDKKEIADLIATSI